MKPPAVIALSRLPSAVLVWEPAPGATSMTVVVKGTFKLAPGELELAEEQHPLCEEIHAGEGVAASLRYPGDFAPSKRRVDVSLVGHAFAPGGAPSSSVVARLAVEGLDKSVRVTGDRAWERPALPFTKMPLTYERAVLTVDNPAGLAARDAPANLTLASGVAADAKAEPVACFGPIAPTWPSRRRLCEEAASFWAHGVARDRRLGGPPPGPAPARFDYAFFNAAPTDQQIDLLRPSAVLELENLHKKHPRLVATLPKLRPQAFALPEEGAKGSVEEIILRCDTLWIDTDREIVVLVWRGTAELVRPLRGVVVIADALGKRLRFAQIERWLDDEVNPTLKMEPSAVDDDGKATERLSLDPLAQRHDALKAALSAIEDEPTHQRGE